MNLGDKVQLVCNATGDSDSPPVIDVNWYRDWVKLNSNAEEDILITNTRVGDKDLVSVLVIAHSKMEDAGDYKCIASHGFIDNKRVHILNGEFFMSEIQIEHSNAWAGIRNYPELGGTGSSQGWNLILKCLCKIELSND